MKRTLFLWMIFLLIVFDVQSQNKDRTGFLFPHFTDGFVYYRDGRRFSVPLNYNLITQQYVFIDKADGNQEKEFTDPGMIVAIEIDNRTFLPPSEGITEIIQAEPPFYVSYEGRVRQEKMLANGGATQTASVDAYSSIRGVGTVGGVDGTVKTLAALSKTYKVKIGKKMKRFSGKKDFLKLFVEKKEILDTYIEEKQIDFDSPQQVLGLYNYARELK